MRRLATDMSRVALRVAERVANIVSYLLAVDRQMSPR